MAHDQFLRDMREHVYVEAGMWTVHYRPLRPRTRKSGRRVTRTDHMRRRRVSKVERMNRALIKGVDRRRMMTLLERNAT